MNSIETEIAKHETEIAKLRSRQALLTAGWPTDLIDVYMAIAPHAEGWRMAEMYLDTQIDDGDGDEEIESVPIMRGYRGQVRAGLAIVSLLRGRTNLAARRTLDAIRERITVEVTS